MFSHRQSRRTHGARISNPDAKCEVQWDDLSISVSIVSASAVGRGKKRIKKTGGRRDGGIGRGFAIASLLLRVLDAIRDTTTLLGINDAFAGCCDDKFTGVSFRLGARSSLPGPRYATNPNGRPFDFDV